MLSTGYTLFFHWQNKNNVLYKLNCVSQEAFFYPYFAPERNEFKRSLSIEKLKINDLQLIFINYFFFYSKYIFIFSTKKNLYKHDKLKQSNLVAKMKLTEIWGGKHKIGGWYICCYTLKIQGMNSQVGSKKNFMV